MVVAPELAPYALPGVVAQAILKLAAESDVLLFGEIHGTQEVPRLVAGLLKDLRFLGYQGLALEAPCHERDALAGWAQGSRTEPPLFFARPGPDGRGNEQVLSLVRQAAGPGSRWQVLCFDLGRFEPGMRWADRDRQMARNLSDQWERFCPGSKVVGVCGNFHSVLVNCANAADGTSEFWPSFANYLRQFQENRAVNSIKVVFHSGSFFNMGVRHRGSRVLEKAEIRRSERGDHSLELHLPRATPATFPTQPLS